MFEEIFCSIVWRIMTTTTAAVRHIHPLWVSVITIQPRENIVYKGVITLVQFSLQLVATQVAWSIAACNQVAIWKNVARQVAAIIAKSRICFYFWQQLLQLVSALHHVDTSATCVATPLRDKLQRKLHCVSAP
jgi:hypothetical protein